MRRREDGLDSTSRQARRLHSRLWRERFPAWIRQCLALEYKGGSVCVDCGYKDNLNALEFDHVPERGRRLFCIGGIAVSLKGLSLSAKRELDKCDVVCANCHRIRTAGRGQQRTAMRMTE